MFVYASLIGLFVAAATAEPIDLTQYVLTNVSFSPSTHVPNELTLSRLGSPMGAIRLRESLYHSVW
jgi:hypothetical protein